MTWRNKATFGTVKIKKSLVLDGGSVVGLLGTNGKEFWVDSGVGTDGVGRGGQKTAPVATFDYAIGLCTADQGDVIHLMEGHAETLASAGAVAWNVDGITVVVHGEGDSRPTFTFSDTAATIAISGNSAKTVGKMILVPSVDSVVSPIVISGTDVDVEFESRDASATVEFVGIVLTTTAAHKLTIDLKHIGFSAGNAGVTAIELIGVEDARINVDYYGISATAIVEMTGTASNDILVTGKFNNIGTTDLSLSVVDTITGSTWAVDGFDAAAGAAFSGGDGNAIAVGDLSTIAAGIVVIDGLHDVPTADASTDAYIRDVVGRKTDAAVTGVTTTKSIMAYAKGNLNDNLALPRCVEKSDGGILNGLDPIFTITGGPVRCKIVGHVTDTVGGASNLRLQHITTAPAATVELNAGAVAVDTDAIGTVYHNLGATSVFTPSGGLGFVLLDPVTVEETELILAPGVVQCLGSAAQTGNIKWYMSYVPLSPDSRVVAAA